MNSKLSYFFYPIFIIFACNPTDTTSPDSIPFQFTTGSSRTYLKYRHYPIDSTIRTITIVGQDTSRWYFEIKDSLYYDRPFPTVTISCDTCIEKNDSLICKNSDLAMYFCPKALYNSLNTPLVVGDKTYYYYHYADKYIGTMDEEESYYFRDIGLVKYYRAHHSPNPYLYGINLIKVNGEDNNLYLYLPVEL